jgi:hypothetical protein
MSDHDSSGVGKRAEKKAEPEEKEGDSPIFKLLTANASLVAWLVFLGFGGALLTFYYMQIGYFPEIAWKDSFTYLAAISLLGGGVVVAYGLLVFIPGVIWSEFLIFDTALRVRLCCDPPNDHEPCYRNTIVHVVAPFGAFMLIMHVARFISQNWVEPVAFGGLAALIGYYWFDFDVLLEHVVHKNEHRSRRIKAVAAATFSAFIGLIALLIIYHFVAPADSSGSGKGRPDFYLLMVCTIVVIASDLFVAVQFRDKLTRAVLTGAVAGLVLLFCGEILAGGAASHSKRILEQFGLGGGDRNAVTILVNEEGQEILKNLDLRLSKDLVERKIPNVKILSRLGSEYCFLIEGRHVVLPKSAVISWAGVVDPTYDHPPILAQAGKSAFWPEEQAYRGFWDAVALLVGTVVGMQSGGAAANLQRRRNSLLKPLFAKGYCAVISGDSFLSQCVSELVLKELNARFDRLGLRRRSKVRIASLAEKLPDARVILCAGSEPSVVSGLAMPFESRLHDIGPPAEYGLIHWKRDTREPHQCFLIIAGDRVDLIQIAIRHVVSRLFLLRLDDRRSEDFEALIRVDGIAGATPEIQTMFIHLP